MPEVWPGAGGVPMNHAPFVAAWRARLQVDDLIPQAGFDCGVKDRSIWSRGHVAVWSPEPVPVYRYLLTRDLDSAGQFPDVGVIMLNPSTADAFKDDPTIRRVRSFADRLFRDWAPTAGIEARTPAIAITNLFALRSTDPKALSDHPDPIGPRNERAIRYVTERSRLLLLAWGASLPKGPSTDAALKIVREAVAYRRRMTGPPVIWMPNPVCLGTTKDGHPRHPLYLAGDTPFEHVPDVGRWDGLSDRPVDRTPSALTALSDPTSTHRPEPTDLMKALDDADRWVRDVHRKR